MNPPDALDLPRDRWLQRLLGGRVPSEIPDGPGRVLRLKLGYNPNSSSVGSVITTLLWTATMGTAALNVATALVRRAAEGAPPTVVGAEAPENADEPRA